MMTKIDERNLVSLVHELSSKTPGNITETTKIVELSKSLCNDLETKSGALQRMKMLSASLDELKTTDVILIQSRRREAFDFSKNSEYPDVVKMIKEAIQKRIGELTDELISQVRFLCAEIQMQTGSNNTMSS